MRYQTFLTFSLFVLGSLTCIAQGNNVDSSKMITLRIEPKNAKGGKVSKIFDEIDFIPLETTNESLFGLISKMEIADQCYVIFDKDTRSILIFKMDGKFISKIDASKLSSAEGETKSTLQGFNIKRQINGDLIRILLGKYFYYFDLTGKQVNKILVKDDVYDWGLRFPDGTAVQDAMPGNNNIYYDLVLRKDRKVVASFFPYGPERYKDNYFSSSINPFTDSKTPGELFFSNYFDYNIYTVTPNNLYLSYRILLPSQNSFPPDFKTNPKYYNKRREYFDENQNKISEIKNVFKIGNNLFFKIYTINGTEFRNSLIHNLKTGTLTSIKDLEPDETSMYLPVTDMGSFNDFDRAGFKLFDGTYLYTTISSLAMFKFKEQSAGKNPKYSRLLQAYFNTQNRKSNRYWLNLNQKKIKFYLNVGYRPGTFNRTSSLIIKI